MIASSNHPPSLVSRLIGAVALSVVTAPAFAQDDGAAMSLDHQGALRCSAAFAIVAIRQQQGQAGQYPALGERGREYFVRAAAKVMEDTNMDRAAISNALRAEAQGLAKDGQLDAVMPACLLMLDAAGL